MIIRLSEKDDIKGIVSLWHEAFGDSEEEIMFFIDNKYIPENTVIAECDGEIASVLFLLEGEMSIKGIKYPSYYLYAACTSKKFRGRGIMSGLLDEAKKIAFLREYDFICLMPGEKSLFDFYEKHGYKTVFSKKIFTVNYNNILKQNIFKIYKKSNLPCSEIRNQAFAEFDFFRWDEQSTEFAFEHTKLYNGNVFQNCNGYCLYTVDDGVVHVKEFAFTHLNLLEIAQFIMAENGAEAAVFNLPSEYKTEIGKYEIVPSAMMICVNERSAAVFESLKNAYLGLTLD